MYVVSFALAIPIRAPEELLDTVARSSDRSRSTKTIPRQPVAEDVTLAARSAEHSLRSGSADVQSPQHLDAVVPPSPNPGSRTRPQPAIDDILTRCLAPAPVKLRPYGAIQICLLLLLFF